MTNAPNFESAAQTAFDDLREAWMRVHLGWLGKHNDPHVTFLLRRLDEARALAKRPAWQPIDTAPKDNKRPLYLARFSENGELAAIDFDGAWEFWQESWELSHINGSAWTSAGGIEEPTHWAFQDEPLPASRAPAKADAQHVAAVRTLENKGYTFHGAELWRPPLGKMPAFAEPKCTTCNGGGHVTASERTGECDFREWEETCPVCDGVGNAPAHVQALQERYSNALGELHCLRMEKGSEALRKLAAEQRVEAWAYELATCKTDGGYTGWRRYVSFDKPNVPEGSIRGLRALTAQPEGDG